MAALGRRFRPRHLNTDRAPLRRAWPRHERHTMPMAPTIPLLGVNARHLGQQQAEKFGRGLVGLRDIAGRTGEPQIFALVRAAPGQWVKMVDVKISRKLFAAVKASALLRRLQPLNVGWPDPTLRASPARVLPLIFKPPPYRALRIRQHPARFRYLDDYRFERRNGRAQRRKTERPELPHLTHKPRLGAYAMNRRPVSRSPIAGLQCLLCAPLQIIPRRRTLRLSSSPLFPVEGRLQHQCWGAPQIARPTARVPGPTKGRSTLNAAGHLKSRFKLAGR